MKIFWMIYYNLNKMADKIIDGIIIVTRIIRMLLFKSPIAVILLKYTKHYIYLYVVYIYIYIYLLYNSITNMYETLYIYIIIILVTVKYLRYFRYRYNKILLRYFPLPLLLDIAKVFTVTPRYC